MVLDLIKELINTIANFIINLIDTTGYLGIFFLMVLESALMPIPSEIIMPFAGFLVSKGNLDFTLVLLAGTLGNVIGSWLAYFLGVFGGRKFIIKYGKYLFIKENHLKVAEKWFEKYGSLAILFSRNLPAIRTVISLPAGIAKMNFKKFSLFTFIGSIPWNFLLTYLGYMLGENWKIITQYSEIIDIIIVIGLIVGIIIFIKILKSK